MFVEFILRIREHSDIFCQLSSFTLSASKFAFLGCRWRFLDFDLTGFKRVWLGLGAFPSELVEVAKEKESEREWEWMFISQRVSLCGWISVRVCECVSVWVCECVSANKWILVRESMCKCESVHKYGMNAHEWLTVSVGISLRECVCVCVCDRERWWERETHLVRN